MGCTEGKTLPDVVKIDVVVCCGSDKETVEGLLKTLREMPTVGSVEFFPLPYNVKDMNKKVSELEKKKFTILCHSINNRRFSITDVTDSLYDGFLAKSQKRLKKKRIGIVAYDFPKGEIEGDRLQARMDAFKSNQPTAFEYSSFALIGGDLSNAPIALQDEQLAKMEECFYQSALSTAQRRNVGKG